MIKALENPLWLDFRTVDENTLHGTGRKIGSAVEGIILQIEKKAETAGALNAKIYIIMDAQLNVQNGKYVSVIYQENADNAETSYGTVCGSDWRWKNTPGLGFT